MLCGVFRNLRVAYVTFVCGRSPPTWLTCNVRASPPELVIVIRYRLKELIADRAFRMGRIVTMDEVARETGLHRMTLSRMANIRGYVTRTDILDKLCEYFGCRLEELAQHIPVEKKPGGHETPATEEHK